MQVRVASAGTGKTTSLVRRYLELIAAGEPLGRVAGVTFTRAAAAELRQRVGDGIGEVLSEGSYLGGLFTAAPSSRPAFERARKELGGAVLSTIHGFMSALLRLSAPSLGLDPSFVVLDEWEAAAIFEEECAAVLMLAAEPSHPLHAAGALLAGEAMGLLLALFARRSLAPRLEFGTTDTEAALGALYRAALGSYDARLGAASLAPGEVERRALAMLERRLPRERAVARFPRVLVDEYQDVNPLQGAFFERLAAAGARLELVGDPKQSIYGFRNADVTVFRRALATGKVLAPLTASRRHARAPVAFLNALTARLAAEGRGFEPGEAPPVVGAGAQADVPGSVELLIVEGDAPLDDLRGREAEVLAERLAEHHAAGVAYEDMAVLARSHAALARVLRALRGHGVPAFVVQGRGYYERSEIRDVKHALAVGIDPLGPSLLPFLRGPFAALTLPEIERVARAEPDERLPLLEREQPAVAALLTRLAELARGTPLQAVTGMLREPLAGGRRFQESLRRRGRENVDALLFEVAGQAPRDVALFLERLDLLARQAEAGDVPQSGSGVRLLSVHASKGLEFRLTAVFDAGARGSTRTAPLLVEPGTGAVRLAHAPGFADAQEAARARDEQEAYRLLYVAASRARDALIITASKRHGPGPWLAALESLALDGAGAMPGVTLTRIPYSEPRPLPSAGADAPAKDLPAARWLGARRAPGRLPPVVSPSAVARLAAPDPDAAEADEPLYHGVRVAGEEEVELGRVGWGRARGTLVHFAIGQDWLPDDPEVRTTLAAQEVLVPFDDEQRAALVDEVVELLGLYRGLLGTVLPALEEREVDRAELPLALSRGATVWEGVLDRLYRVGGEWFLDDYKTDKRLAPERYHLQLAHYLDAAERALGVRPRGRLVYLRHGKVIEPSRSELDAALAAAV